MPYNGISRIHSERRCSFMECPYCGNDMTKGAVKCVRSAPLWKGEDGERFSFGQAKLIVNTTKNAWYCRECDCLIVKPIGAKIKRRLT